jgi:heterodisulfide reductase subunit B
MRYYTFFPGCCLWASAKGYGLSIEPVSSLFEMKLVELEDWNCCGATACVSAGHLEATCIAARNLALAKKKGLDLVTPCSCCYGNFNRVNSQLKLYPELEDKVNSCLGDVGLEYHGEIRVRHLWEVMFNDITLEVIKSKVVKPLTGLKVAPYYGCQLIRPGIGFDDPEFPQSLDQLITSLGAEATPFPLKSRCCGGSLIISQMDLALSLIRQLFDSAQSGGAQCLVTTCPLCYLNLEAFQSTVNRKYKTKYNLPVLFFTQLIGLALGIDPKALGLDTAIVSAQKMLASVG